MAIVEADQMKKQGFLKTIEKRFQKNNPRTRKCS